RNWNWVPTVLSGEDLLHGDSFCLLCGQLPGPFDAGRGIGSGSGAVEFGIARGFFGLGFPPIVPAFGPDHTGHFGTEKSRAGIDAPGTAEKGFHLRGLAGDFAVGEHKAVGLVVRRGRSGEVPVAEAMDMAFLEEGGGSPEDEI